jgi:2-keto-3-deoxy-L-rhamnonate aldolase RhmA
MKKRLKQGGVVLGTMIADFTSPEVTRPIAVAGFDFALIDTEHGPFSLETVADMVRTSKSTDLTMLARVPTADYFHVARTLDAGVHGVMIPHVERVSEVKSALDAMKYPPIGQRSYGLRPVVTDYKPATVKDQIASLNDNTILIIQIESVKAIEDIESLVSVSGVDVALIGPNDLSISLGCPGELNHPRMVEAISKVLDVAEKYDVAVGNHLRDMKSLLGWRDRGMRVLMFSNDSGLFLSACQDAVQKLRSPQ